MHTQEDIEKLAQDFAKCQKILTAFGDENRQHLIMEMMKMGKCSGVRVVEITTKNYYYFDPNLESMDCLISLLVRARNITAELPDRSGEDEQRVF